MSFQPLWLTFYKIFWASVSVSTQSKSMVTKTTDILQSIFCVLQQTYISTGLEWHEGEQMMIEFSIWVNYLFQYISLIKDSTHPGCVCLIDCNVCCKLHISWVDRSVTQVWVFVWNGADSEDKTSNTDRGNRLIKNKPKLGQQPYEDTSWGTHICCKQI